MLQHGDLWLQQGQAIAMYCQDVGLNGKELTSQQRAVDMMFLAIWEDMVQGFFKCLYFGNDDDKKKAREALPGMCQKFLTAIERMLPNEGFVHGRDIPSMADIVCFSICDLMKKCGADYSAYPKFNTTVLAVGFIPGAMETQ